MTIGYGYDPEQKKQSLKRINPIQDNDVDPVALAGRGVGWAAKKAWNATKSLPTLLTNYEDQESIATSVSNNPSTDHQTQTITSPTPTSSKASVVKPSLSPPAMQSQKPFNAATPGGLGYSVDAVGNRTYTMGTAGSPGYGYMKVHAGQNSQTRPLVMQGNVATSPAYSHDRHINGGYSFQGPPADAARFYEPIITGPNANNLSGPTNETFRRYRAAELAEQNGPHFVTPREYGWGWKGHNERVASQIQNGLEQARLAQSQQSLDMQDLSSQYKHQIDQARLANEQAQLQQQLAQGGLAYAQGMNQFGYNRQLQQMRQQLSQLDPNSQAARDLQWRINALGGDNTQPERKYIPRTSEDALGNKITDFYTPNQDGSLSRVQILDEQNDGGVKSTEQFERQKKEVMSKLGNKEQQAALESALQSARTLEQRQAIISSFLEKLK